MNVAAVSVISLTINIFLGRHRRKYKKMTLMWWIMIHASIPLIIPLRIWLDTPKIFIPLFIGFAVLGQLIGSNVVQRFQCSEWKDKVKK
jgi:drug/metabolite transporter (DMT)-like permease